ncbi:MAG: serine dehydrogenasease [Acidobacteria bacterium]|nr:serine dehydrogenasease [Acidobacteriota bacterium]
MQLYDDQIKAELKDRLAKLEEHFGADVAFYYGPIHPAVQKRFRDFIEKLKEDSRGDHLVLFLNTPGGSVETVEKLVEIVRFHYRQVSFVVPDYAMSAGTVFCASGDRIFMDYSSSLGPIDPQVFNGKEWVPALGYLDQVEKMLEKAADDKLTNAEFLILQSLDLAMLSRYEQARALTVTLLKKWLVEYKFKDWIAHRTDPLKLGQPVTHGEKEVRAEDIAKKLGDNRTWHSHGRMIGPQTLSGVLRLEIEDYSNDRSLRKIIRSYNDFIVEFIARGDYKTFLHSKNYF